MGRLTAGKATKREKERRRGEGREERESSSCVEVCIGKATVPAAAEENKGIEAVLSSYRKKLPRDLTDHLKQI